MSGWWAGVRICGFALNILMGVVTADNIRDGIDRVMPQAEVTFEAVQTFLEKALHCGKFALNTTTAGIVAAQLYNIYVGERAIKEMKKMGTHLKRIAESLDSAHSRGDSFPLAVYNFVLSKIRSHQASKIPHYFFIYNPDTDWHPKFDRLIESDPLPLNFCGYYKDLDFLCALLLQVLRPQMGPDAVFHILIPSKGALLIADPLKLPPGLGPLRIEGELGNGGQQYV
jgi:hypothetical protein